MVKLYCTVILLLSVGVFQSGFTEKVTTSIIASVFRNKPKDVIFSPLLVTDGLWQLYLGAEGATANEISQVLQLNGKTKSQAIEEYSNWRLKLNKDKDVNINYANRLFTANEVNILPQYQQEATRIFENNPQAVNFKKSPATSALINDWATKVTKGKITHFLNSVDYNTKAVFLSTIYFKGLWKYQFFKDRTRKDNFYIPYKNTGIPRQVKVDMMTQYVICRRNFIDKLDAWSLELPYSNTNISMVILLPRFSNGIDKIVANLNQMDLNDIVPEKNLVAVDLDLPKFKMDARIDLKDALINVGLVQFSQFANVDFSAMTDFRANMRLSHFIQRALLEVDEKGSAAYPIHEIKRPYYKVRVNHPFVYLIKDNDIVYLAGRVINP